MQEVCVPLLWEGEALCHGVFSQGGCQDSGTRKLKILTLVWELGPKKECGSSQKAPEDPPPLKSAITLPTVLHTPLGKGVPT